jgi:hypothetical protein
MEFPLLRNLNISAAVLHFALLLVLVVWKFYNKDVITTAPIFDSEYRVDDNAGCKRWFEVTLSKTGGEIDVWSLTVAFTVITIFAHVCYASLLLPFYESQITQGRNPLRWIEYFFSATLMALILGLTAGVRIEGLVVLLGASTAAQMFQGFTIESAVSQFKKWYSFDVLLPFIAGWGLFAAAWYAILSQWYRGFNSSKIAYASCPADENPYNSEEGGAPEWLVQLIWVIFAFFASFGIVNLAHIIIGSKMKNNKYFYSIEMAYIALSFASKAILVLWGSFTVFSKLEWLQVCGYNSSDCISPYLPSYTPSGEPKTI